MTIHTMGMSVVGSPTNQSTYAAQQVENLGNSEETQRQAAPATTAGKDKWKYFGYGILFTVVLLLLIGGILYFRYLHRYRHVIGTFADPKATWEQVFNQVERLQPGDQTRLLKALGLPG